MAHRRRQTETKVGFPRRGEIYLVTFDPTVGHEIQKSRPALIIQNDVSNRYSPSTIVAAISPRFGIPPHPREAVLQPSESGLSRTSAVVVEPLTASV